MRGDFFWVVGGRLVLVFFSLIAIRCVSYFLSPAQYGELAVVIAIQTFCGFLLINPLSQHLNRFTHQWWQDNTLLPRLLSLSYYIVSFALLGACVCFFLKNKVGYEKLIWRSVSVFFMILMVSWNGILIYLLNMLGFRRSAVIWGAVTAIASLIFSIVLFFLFSDAVAWYLGQALGMTIGVIGSSYKFYSEAIMRRVHLQKLPFLDWDTVRFYCFPLAIATGFMWLQWNGWRFVVEHFWSLEILGYMAMGLTIAAQVWGLFESLAMQFLFPLFFYRIAHKNQQSVVFSDFLNILGPIYLVLAGFVIFVSPILLKFLAASQYRQAGFFVICALMVEFCRVLAGVFAIAVQVTGKTIILSIPYAVGGVFLLIGLWYVGIKNEDIKSAVFIMMVAGVITVFMMIFLMKRQLMYVLDKLRWSVAVAVFLIVIIAKQFFIFSENLAILFFTLFIIGLLCLSIVFLLSRNNPALHRMLAVRLKQHEFSL